MKIVTTSDWHGTIPEIPECDLLLISGDVCPVQSHERKFQANWLRGVFRPALEEIEARGTEVVWTGGNHDFVLAESEKIVRELPGTFLNNTDTVTKGGLKVWGSPMSPTFGNWAFMRDDRGLAEEWAKIPEDVDILMVHGPMHGYGDIVPSYAWNMKRGEWEVVEHVGSITLLNRLTYGNFPRLSLFVFGHIHEGYGQGVVERITGNPVVWINASHMNATYHPVNAPVVFEW